MARPGITETEVFTTIETLTDRGFKITVESIRAELQRGSPNTINRHLRTWRELQELEKSGSNNDKIKRLREQNLALQLETKQHQQQLQLLTAELLEKDLKNQQISKELQTIAADKEHLVQELKLTQSLLEKAGKLYQDSIMQNESRLNAVIAAQLAQAEQFSKDLQAINKTSLESVREIGLVNQDLLMAEKLKTKDLQVQVGELHSKLAKLQQELDQTRNQQLPLHKRLKQQEQLIANCLDPDKFSRYSQITEKEI